MAKSVQLLPLPMRITGDRFEPGDTTAVAVSDGEHEVMVLVHVDEDRIVVQALTDIPTIDILRGEVFVTGVISTTRG